ncbi:MAG: fibronectin type III domain-containing protein, partial [Planctomycetaceae bacterium]|nr:fibronectin type III domain-containing protein [Planctomycetaceae bacterium]
NNFHTVVIGQTTNSLDWNNVEGATNYILERKNSTGNFDIIYQNSTTSKFSDTGLTADTEYEYRLQAITSDGSTAYAYLTVKTANTTDSKGNAIADIPVFSEPTIDNVNNTVTLTWTNLGADYSYYLYKAGKPTTVTEDNYTFSASNEVEGYVLMAYNLTTGATSAITTTVVYSSTAKPIEITGYEITHDGNIALQWQAESGFSYFVYRDGKVISGTSAITADSNANNGIITWTDTQTKDDNNYMLFASYDTNFSKQTFSNLYNAKKPSSALPAALPLNF